MLFTGFVLSCCIALHADQRSAPGRLCASPSFTGGAAQDKREQGHYLNPELYGATAEQRIVHARFANSRHKKETIEDVGTALKQAQNRSPKISKMEGLFKEGPL